MIERRIAPSAVGTAHPRSSEVLSAWGGGDEHTRNFFDDYDVQLFPEEAPTRAKRLAANFFLEHHVFMPVWNEVAYKAEWDEGFIPEYTAEWLKQQYAEHLEFLNEEASVLPAGDPRDPRFTLEHLYGEAQRQWAKAQHRKTEFDLLTASGRADIQALDYYARVYSTIQGLIEQAVQLDTPPGLHPVLPGPMPTRGNNLVTSTQPTQQSSGQTKHIR